MGSAFLAVKQLKVLHCRIFYELKHITIHSTKNMIFLCTTFNDGIFHRATTDRLTFTRLSSFNA